MTRDLIIEFLATAERIVGRTLTEKERLQLIDEANSGQGAVYDNCVAAIEKVLNVTVESQELLEKTASFDMAMTAINNLKKLQAASKKSSRK